MAKLGKFMQGSRSLYKELEEEILSRLPVKSLARCRCVCKSWRDLIRTERFVSLHRKNYNSSYLLVGNGNVFAESPLISFLPPLPALVSNDISVVAMPKVEGFELPPTLQASGRYMIMTGACNGIICLHAGQPDKIVLWNPATREFKIIPDSNIHRPSEKPFYCVVGFGFDPKRNDYKVLQVVHYFRHPVPQFELFSLRMNSWKKLDSNEFFVESPQLHDKVCNLPGTENRVVCMLGTRKKYSSRFEVMFFDVRSETFEIIPVLPSIDVKRSNSHTNLFPFKKSIAIGVGHLPGCCDIWVLDDFYSTQSRSWSKLLSIEGDLMRGPRPIFGGWESLILVQGLAVKGEIGLIMGLFECSKDIFLDVKFPTFRRLTIACIFKGKPRQNQTNRGTKLRRLGFCLTSFFYSYVISVYRRWVFLIYLYSGFLDRFVCNIATFLFDINWLNIHGYFSVDSNLKWLTKMYKFISRPCTYLLKSIMKQ